MHQKKGEGAVKHTGAALDLYHSAEHEREGAAGRMLCCLLHSRWSFDRRESLGSAIRLSSSNGTVCLAVK